MRLTIGFTLNGHAQRVDVDPHQRLLDYLREQVRLTAAKEGCGEGECGACAVSLNGQLVNSCLLPMGQLDGARIDTAEHIAAAHPLGQHFVDAGAAQCGICTPGMLLAAYHLLQTHPQPDLDQIREGLAGNLCRCTGYTRIYAAVQAAAGTAAEADRDVV